MDIIDATLRQLSIAAVDASTRLADDDRCSYGRCSHCGSPGRSIALISLGGMSMHICAECAARIAREAYAVQDAHRTLHGVRGRDPRLGHWVATETRHPLAEIALAAVRRIEWTPWIVPTTLAPDQEERCDACDRALDPGEEGYTPGDREELLLCYRCSHILLGGWLELADRLMRLIP